MPDRPPLEVRIDDDPGLVFQPLGDADHTQGVDGPGEQEVGVEVEVGVRVRVVVGVAVVVEVGVEVRVKGVSILCCLFLANLRTLRPAVLGRDI